MQKIQNDKLKEPTSKADLKIKIFLSFKTNIFCIKSWFKKGVELEKKGVKTYKKIVSKPINEEKSI